MLAWHMLDNQTEQPELFCATTTGNALVPSGIWSLAHACVQGATESQLKMESCSSMLQNRPPELQSNIAHFRFIDTARHHAINVDGTLDTSEQTEIWRGDGRSYRKPGFRRTRAGTIFGRG